jgi:AcrR family transcriptional regulator
MARPKIPLISRRKAVEEALKIIDTEGLDAFSIRRLAERLGVNGASLYHHFANKEEIVVRAAELALADVRTPEASEETWHIWLPRNAKLLGLAIREHPELVPVIVSRSTLGMGSRGMEATAARLVEEGVPIGAVLPLLEALEIFAIGAAIHETRDHDEQSVLDPASMLVQADHSRSLSFDEVYDIVSTAIVESIAAAAAAKPSVTPKARKATAKNVGGNRVGRESTRSAKKTAPAIKGVASAKRVRRPA